MFSAPSVTSSEQTGTDSRCEEDLMHNVSVSLALLTHIFAHLSVLLSVAAAVVSLNDSDELSSSSSSSEEEEEEEEDSVELAQEADVEAAGLEGVLETPAAPPVEVHVAESEGPTESYDRDETTVDDSILDSSWVDTQGELAIMVCFFSPGF